MPELPDAIRTGLLAQVWPDRGYRARTVRLWDLEERSERLNLQGHAREVTALAYGSDGERFASAGGGGMVKVWDAGTGDELLAIAAIHGAARPSHSPRTANGWPPPAPTGPFGSGMRPPANRSRCCPVTRVKPRESPSQRTDELSSPPVPIARSGFGIASMVWKPLHSRKRVCATACSKAGLSHRSRHRRPLQCRHPQHRSLSLGPLNRRQPSRCRSRRFDLPPRRRPSWSSCPSRVTHTSS